MLKIFYIFLRYILIAYNNLYARIYRPLSIGLQLSFVWLFSFSIMVRLDIPFYLFCLNNLQIIFSDTTVFGYMGSGRSERGHFFLHHFREGWTFHKEVPIPRRIPYSVHCHNFIVFVHLLDCAPAASKDRPTQKCRWRSRKQEERFMSNTRA